jgi:hypothetical protein
MSNGDCVRDCRPVNGVLAHDLALHLGLRCHKCGHFITWFNDVPLRGFCWGPEAKEHPEWSALVPAEYNPYL